MPRLRDLSIAASIAMTLGVGAPSAHGKTLEEIEACMRANVPETTSVQKVVMRTKDRAGAITETRAEVFWKKFEDDLSRVRMQFSDPPDLRGAGLLVLEKVGRNDMFMYLPELRRVKRVTGRMVAGSMFGTDFTYEQFERLQGIADDVSTEKLDDDEVGGRPVWVLNHIPETDPGSPTERVLAFIDQETCVLLRTDYFETGDRVRRRLITDPERVLKASEHWVPRQAVMRDLRDETETELEVLEVEIGVEINRSLFTERTLARGR